MSKTPLDPNANGSHYWVRRAINHRWENVFAMSGSISPFERWPDDNYTPRPLHVQRYETDDAYIVSAELPGYESPDIHLDIRRDHLIILVAPDDQPSENEAYAEVALPSFVSRGTGVVEFSEGLLTVSFSKSPASLLEWMRMASGRLQKSLNPFGRQQKGAFSG